MILYVGFLPAELFLPYKSLPLLKLEFQDPFLSVFFSDFKNGLAYTLNERAHRMLCATEAEAIGHGGITAVHKATGVTRRTIHKGLKELELEKIVEPERIRRKGGGRKKIVELIGNTTTKTGLKVQTSIDKNHYETGRKISDEEFDSINIEHSEFQKKWNYTIWPRSTL